MQLERERSNGRLGRWLGWFSVGLGAAEVAAPRALSRFIGVPARARSTRMVRAYGARELAVGAGLLARPGSLLLPWARVLGDVVDLASLVIALGARQAKRRRGMIGLVAVAGALALDVFAGLRRLRARAPRFVSVTIARSPSAVTALLHDLWDRPGIFFKVQRGEIAVGKAPGDASQVKVQVGNPVGAERARADLRRLKQVAELGEVVHSDASIHRGRHPARPSGEGER